MNGTTEELRRRKKLDSLSVNPFRQTSFVRSTNIASIISSFSELDREQLQKKQSKVRIAGRLLRLRKHGKLVFADLVDQFGIVQLKTNDVSFSELDIGDIIGLEGIVCRTHKGELTVDTHSFVLLSKCLKPLPDVHYGFTNTEERYQKRYLDFMMNRQNRDVLVLRHQIVKGIRDFLDSRGFLEIETPILVAEASGAAARPFVTYHNTLKKNFYLRIATEIPLKKMIVAGFEKIYEIGRVFRNEGIDSTHAPEFSSVEIYCAYENSSYVMNLTEELLRNLETTIILNSCKFSDDFQRISMIEAVRQYSGEDFSQRDLTEALHTAKRHQLDLKPFQHTIGHILVSLFEKYVVKELIKPTFVYDFPIEISPLAKSKVDNNNIADRFELYIDGIEFANGYSELNDPIEQKKRFEEQIQQKVDGNQEITSFDQSFIEALEYGMGPTGGLGIGIDRLIMLFANKKNIKEVVAN